MVFAPAHFELTKKFDEDPHSGGKPRQPAGERDPLLARSRRPTWSRSRFLRAVRVPRKALRPAPLPVGAAEARNGSSGLEPPTELHHPPPTAPPRGHILEHLPGGDDACFRRRSQHQHLARTAGVRSRRRRACCCPSIAGQAAAAARIRDKSSHSSSAQDSSGRVSAGRGSGPRPLGSLEEAHFSPGRSAVDCPPLDAYEVSGSLTAPTRISGAVRRAGQGRGGGGSARPGCRGRRTPVPPACRTICPFTPISIWHNGIPRKRKVRREKGPMSRSERFLKACRGRPPRPVWFMRQAGV